MRTWHLPNSNVSLFARISRMFSIFAAFFHQLYHFCVDSFQYFCRLQFFETIASKLMARRFVCLVCVWIDVEQATQTICEEVPGSWDPIQMKFKLFQLHCQLFTFEFIVCLFKNFFNGRWSHFIVTSASVT